MLNWSILWSGLVTAVATAATVAAANLAAACPGTTNLECIEHSWAPALAAGLTAAFRGAWLHSTIPPLK